MRQGNRLLVERRGKLTNQFCAQIKELLPLSEKIKAANYVLVRGGNSDMEELERVKKQWQSAVEAISQTYEEMFTTKKKKSKKGKKKSEQSAREPKQR